MYLYLRFFVYGPSANLTQLYSIFALIILYIYTNYNAIHCYRNDICIGLLCVLFLHVLIYLYFRPLLVGMLVSVLPVFKTAICRSACVGIYLYSRPTYRYLPVFSTAISRSACIGRWMLTGTGISWWYSTDCSQGTGNTSNFL